ncbi:MAG: LPXTG cell wall anchor domain-containing protein, partial [Bifidobacterium castoris]|nr:LPXTG cell wall anchor domain-containing protein [Bifidobacterium castoris]
GSQTINTQTEPTNEPWICGWVPPVVKDVVSEASQGGEQESVDGKVVFPGQRVEYQLTTTPKLPGNLAYQVEHVAVTDQYDEHLVPDKQTLEVTDLTTGKSVSKKQYTTQWDDAAHMFTLTFADAYVAANWRAGQNPRIMVRFEGTVSEDAPADTKVDNQWMLTLNNTITPSNKVFNIPPDITPDKQDTQQDPTIDIDGKTALLGDRIYYRVGLDLKNVDQNNLAYRVQRAGIVDDYDDEYLTADEHGVEILNETGKDVTSKFNIQFADGVAYVFAKTVDTEIPATGETVKGDPQPTDLKEYSERKLDPLKDAYIDQSLLGQKYQVVLPMTVTKVTDGYTVVNKATQITNDRRDETNVVSNPLKEINPSKDVVVNMGDESANGKSIYLGSTFLYQLDSSILPADRAYQQVTDWKIVDKLDTAHDQYTGQWAVYAARDLKDGDTVLAAKGERIAGTGVDSAKYGGDLFTTVQADDGTITVAATQRYLDLVSASDAEAGWRAYIQCTRIAVGDKIVNRFTETLNGTDRPSNEVWTKTPDQTPSIDVEKYDIQSGEADGDRDDPTQALKMDGADQEIGIKVTNTGKVDLAKLTLTDALLAGSGELEDIEYPKDWDTLVLKPGQS